MNESERRRARTDAITALVDARHRVQRYIDCFASSAERVDLVGMLPEFESWARRFEWETSPVRDREETEKRTIGER